MVTSDGTGLQTSRYDGLPLPWPRQTPETRHTRECTLPPYVLEPEVKILECVIGPPPRGRLGHHLGDQV